jgi:hypothetical protein
LEDLLMTRDPQPRLVYAFGGDLLLREYLTTPDTDTGVPIPATGLTTVEGGFVATLGGTDFLGSGGDELLAPMTELAAKQGWYVGILQGTALGATLGALAEGTRIWRYVHTADDYRRYVEYEVRHYRA